MKEFMQKLLCYVMNLLGKIFVKTSNTEKMLIDYASGNFTIEQLAREHKDAARLIRRYCRIVCRRKVTVEEAILFFTEYRNFMYAVQTKDTTMLTKDIERHQAAGEYEDIADYVSVHTGQYFVFMYSPVLLRALKSSTCALFNIHYDGCMVVIYDDIFKNISDTDRRCFALHEAGHAYYRHLETFTQEEIDHEMFCGPKVAELEADDYATYIVGAENMKNALIHAHCQLSLISRLMGRKELYHRLKELKQN